MQVDEAPEAIQPPAEEAPSDEPAAAESAEVFRHMYIGRKHDNCRNQVNDAYF